MEIILLDNKFVTKNIKRKALQPNNIEEIFPMKTILRRWVLPKNS